MTETTKAEEAGPDPREPPDSTQEGEVLNTYFPVITKHVLMGMASRTPSCGPEGTVHAYDGRLASLALKFPHYLQPETPLES